MCANAMATLRASGTLDSDDFERGFDRVLAEIADIKLDFPDAVDECVVFLARAVADEVVCDVSGDGVFAGRIRRGPRRG